MTTVYALSASSRKRAVTIDLPDALAEAIPRAREDFHRRSNVMGHSRFPYPGSGSDS